ncbi:MAG: valine--tRNA ligase [Holosporales bacterium]|jgi:valyl-tRNA synthetase|nr:valine--tRNA ligase [Holosporales bacterium]
MLGKLFDYAQIEPKIIEKARIIIAQTIRENVTNKTFTITLPPPNITGSLHLGHAFTSVIQDILLRVKRQHGYVTLGQPGIDHAGIAAQIVVANQLYEKGISLQSLGREDFIKKVWSWKEQSGDMIVHQLVKLGMSIDLDRLRFTMDQDASKAVLKAFTMLYNDGLIYKAKRIVNWDPILKTAVSDLEVSNKIEPGKMWYIRYQLQQDEFIVIATTRPETIFGDQALAVHPNDERYMHLVDKEVKIPLTNRRIHIIADEHADPQKGSGIFKVTPGHDFFDFDVGKRHNLPILSIMDESACLNNEVPEDFRHLPVAAAREKVLAALAHSGLLEKTEDIVHSVPYNDRSGAVIEPMVTNQWFLETTKLADAAIRAVEDGKVKFVPDQWVHTYFEWLRNIQPWCLSRQIWWGHQIPVWYAPNGKMFCALTEEEAIQQAASYFDVAREFVPKLTQEQDVLDTWFSSALWPFVTLGWPKDSEDLKKYYPTDVLVTGFDIIFFWVSRMIMFSLYFTGDVPFSVVYINPLVRDENGQKMSKSKGNVIDPLYLMDKYGTDALRFTLTLQAIPGRDIRIGESLVECGRNFITKIWNAAKFLTIKECAYDVTFSMYSPNIVNALNKWIIRQMVCFKKQAFAHLENYRLDLFAQSIQKFLRDIFCDVYIEAIKTCDDVETKNTAISVFAEFLKVAHSITPFITEYLWEEMYSDKTMLLVEPWEYSGSIDESPDLTNFWIDVAAEIRSLYGLIGITQKSDLLVIGDEYNGFIQANEHWIKQIARLNSLQFVNKFSRDGIRFIVRGKEFCLKYSEKISVAIFDKKISTLSKDIQRLTLKIDNLQYKNAKPDKWNVDYKFREQKQQDLAKMLEIRGVMT